VQEKDPNFKELTESQCVTWLLQFVKDCRWNRIKDNQNRISNQQHLVFSRQIWVASLTIKKLSSLLMAKGTEVLKL